MGVLAVVISTMALILNIIYNWLFDKIFPFNNGHRSVRVRIIHAVGFEGTLVVFTIPVIALILNVGLIEAFMIEIGILIFFLFYTYIFNVIYDHLRRKFIS